MCTLTDFGFGTQEDPELRPMFEEMQKGGMQALMKFMNDPKMLAKVGKKLGDINLPVEKAAAPPTQKTPEITNLVEAAKSALLLSLPVQNSSRKLFSLGKTIAMQDLRFRAINIMVTFLFWPSYLERKEPDIDIMHAIDLHHELSRNPYLSCQSICNCHYQVRSLPVSAPRVKAVAFRLVRRVKYQLGNLISLFVQIWGLGSSRGFHSNWKRRELGEALQMWSGESLSFHRITRLEQAKILRE